MSGRMNHHDYPIGCEVGVDAVRLAQVRSRSGRTEVVVAEAVIAVPGAGQHAPSPQAAGEATQAALREAVSEALRAARFTGRRVVSCVEPAAMKVRPVRLAPMPEAELASAAHWKVATELGVKAERLKCAVIPVGKVAEAGKTRTEAVVVAAEVEALERHAAALAAAGLEPVAIDLPTCAVARCLAETTGAAEAATPTLELQRHAATLSASRGGRVAFLRGVGAGLGRVDDIVANLLDVSPAQVAALYHALATSVGGASEWPLPDLPAERVDKAVSDAWAMYGRELAREVALSLRYFCDTFGQPLQAAGVIVADAPVGREVIDVLLDQAGVAFAPPDAAVFGRFPGATTGDAADDAGRWLTAVGLSLYYCAEHSDREAA